jgi:uncharacterized protein (DUF433 family)
MNLDERITFDIHKCEGVPTIRGMRIRVSDILEMLAQNVSMEEMLEDFPDLEREDILACLHFAAQRTAVKRVAA